MAALASHPSTKPSSNVNRPVKPFAPALKKESELKTLVENRSVYSLDTFELNVFETHRRSENVRLCFNSLVLTTMLRGKKTMRLFNGPSFDYLPGESVIVPENEVMTIDFPEARAGNPTQCLAVAVRSETVRQTLDQLNERYPKAEPPDAWRLDPQCFHLANTPEVASAVDRLVRVTMEESTVKDILARFALQELLIRLMQTQARHHFFDHYARYASTHRFAYVVQYIQHHLSENLTVEKLSGLACMSKPHFFRSFKRELGLTPVEYVIRERLKLAKQLLANPRTSLYEVGCRAGFNSANYFHILFKKHEGITPKAYRASCPGE